MVVQVPTPDQLRAVADEMGLSLTGADVDSFINLMRPSVAAYNVVDSIPDNLPTVKYPRTPGYRPQSEENRHNAWYVKTVVEGAPSGKLKGKTVVLKDNITLTGVPMMNGASTLEGYVPDVDATVVQRILDAGGAIVGKAHCEYFCLSGAVTPVRPVRCTIRTRWATRPAAHHLAAQSWSRSVRSTWRSAAIRVDQSGCRRRFAEPTA
jgi:amidase